MRPLLVAVGSDDPKLMPSHLMRPGSMGSFFRHRKLFSFPSFLGLALCYWSVQLFSVVVLLVLVRYVELFPRLPCH